MIVEHTVEDKNNLIFKEKTNKYFHFNLYVCDRGVCVCVTEYTNPFPYNTRICIEYHHGLMGIFCKTNVFS